MCRYIHTHTQADRYNNYCERKNIFNNKMKILAIEDRRKCCGNIFLLVGLNTWSPAELLNKILFIYRMV